jgi:hypothetical protein
MPLKTNENALKANFKKSITPICSNCSHCHIIKEFDDFNSREETTYFCKFYEPYPNQGECLPEKFREFCITVNNWYNGNKVDGIDTCDNYSF